MSTTNRVAWELLRSFDTSTISSDSAYYPVGTPLLFPSYKLKIVNNSSVLLLVSVDGVNPYDVIPAMSFALYDESQAQFNASSFPATPAGTQISVNSASGDGTGLVYIVSQYLVQG